jgi:hypothetical protein
LDTIICRVIRGQVVFFINLLSLLTRIDNQVEGCSDGALIQNRHIQEFYLGNVGANIVYILELILQDSVVSSIGIEFVANGRIVVLIEHFSIGNFESIKLHAEKLVH